MTIKGVISNIIFANKDNGYTVLVVDCEEENTSMTCVGNMPIVSVGETVILTGTLTVHAKFGEQFIVSRVEVTSPQTIEGLIKYLSSGLIKGIGEVTARAIVNKFGLKTIEIITNDPNKLTLVKGISPTKALNFSNSLQELVQMQAHVMFLQSFNISTNLAIKIYNIYKDNTKQIVTANPYKLIDDIDGIGFITADKIASNMGIASTSQFRIRAAIIYLLKDSADKSGNTAVEADKLKDLVVDLLEVDEDICAVYDSVIDLLMIESCINIVDLNGIKCIALNKYYVLERNIASSIIILNNQAAPLATKMDSLIMQFEAINNVKLHENQLKAINNAISSGVCVITGGPGTGKTTIIKCIAYLFKSQGLKIEFTAPTGRASKRLSQSSGEDAKTIHRLLGMEFSGGKLNFYYNANNPINADVIIVDEMSMVDVNIMNSLLKAIRRGSHLVMVGDKDQLPSVGAGNVLGDIIASGLIEVNHLTHIYRQAANSLIVSNAHLINNCKMPIVNNDNKDFFVVYNDDADRILETVCELVKTRLPSYTKVDSLDIQVLAPLKGGVSGVDNINICLQKLCNPPSPNKGQLTFSNTIFRLGDKVMQIVNDYELEWTRQLSNGQLESGTGVFNGDIGIISHINSSEGYAEVTFEDSRIAQYSTADLVNIMLAYSITIHKSQGSEFDVVVIPLSAGPPTICNKNLLYTAVTRAKKVVVLVCNRKHLYSFVHNNYSALRLTLLPKFMMEEYAKYQTLYN